MQEKKNSGENRRRGCDKISVWGVVEEGFSEEK